VNGLGRGGRRIRLRPAVSSDAAAIGAVFDAAVRAGWTYLGELVAEPMFTQQDWDQLVAGHTPPKVLRLCCIERSPAILTRDLPARVASSPSAAAFGPSRRPW